MACGVTVVVLANAWSVTVMVLGNAWSVTVMVLGNACGVTVIVLANACGVIVKVIKGFNILQGGFCASDNVSCLSGSLLTKTYYFS